MGVAGEKGAFAVLRCVGGRCFGKKTSGVGQDMAESGDFWRKTMRRERSFPGRLAKIVFGSGLFGRERFRPSGVVENQSPAVAKGDFFGLPGGLTPSPPPSLKLWRSRRLRRTSWPNESGSESDGGLRLLEPIQIRFVIGNAPAAFRRRMMKTRSGGGSCRRHGQSGASAIHSLTACHGGSMGSMVIRIVAHRLLAFPSSPRL